MKTNGLGNLNFYNSLQFFQEKKWVKIALAVTGLAALVGLGIGIAGIVCQSSVLSNQIIFLSRQNSIILMSFTSITLLVSAISLCVSCKKKNKSESTRSKDNVQLCRKENSIVFPAKGAEFVRNPIEHAVNTCYIASALTSLFYHSNQLNVYLETACSKSTGDEKKFLEFLLKKCVVPIQNGRLITAQNIEKMRTLAYRAKHNLSSSEDLKGAGDGRKVMQVIFNVINSLDPWLCGWDYLDKNQSFTEKILEFLNVAPRKPSIFLIEIAKKEIGKRVHVPLEIPLENGEIYILRAANVIHQSHETSVFSHPQLGWMESDDMEPFLKQLQKEEFECLISTRAHGYLYVLKNEVSR
jgi:hypothetical protein